MARFSETNRLQHIPEEYTKRIDGNDPRLHHNGYYHIAGKNLVFLNPSPGRKKQRHDAKSKRRLQSRHASRKTATSAGAPRHGAPPSGQEAKVKALLDSDFDAHVVLRAVRDAQGRVTDFIFAEANDFACTYNRLTRRQMVGRRLLKLFPNAKQTGLFDMYRRILETGDTLELRDFSYPHDMLGQKRRFDIRAIPVGDELAYTWRDVTDRPLPPGGDQPDARPAVLERRKRSKADTDAAHQLREFQSLTHHLLELRQQEQQSISRELHDNIAQVLSAVTTRITLAEKESIPAWLRQELFDLRDHIKSALADVRTLARELRPAAFDHSGFTSALANHATAFRERTRIDLEICLVPEAVRFLGKDGLTHLFRLTQEALQNIEEHSGAQNAWIDLWPCHGVLHLEIGDDGCSFTPVRVNQAQEDGHLGLLGMRERAELLGGTFCLDAVPDQGTVIRVTIPPPEKNPNPKRSGKPDYQI